MKPNFKKIIKYTLRLSGIFGIFALLWSWNTYGKFVMAANSVKQLSDHFYYMEFKGDTQFKDYLNKGGAENNSQLAGYIENLLRGKKINKVYRNEIPLNTGCAAFSSKTPDNKVIFGRNYDWQTENFKTAMIIKFSPKNGYKSISTTQLDFLGFGDNFKPETFATKYLSTAALFIPLDGMNEKGLCISDLMAGDTEFTNQDNGKNDVTTTLAIRGVLDFCANVPEAIEFLENYDMHSVIGYAHHFAISDSTGRMVVVEYVDNKMYVTEANAVTNHYLCTQRIVDGMDNSTHRLGVLTNTLNEKKNLTENDAKEALYNIRASKFKETSKTWWRAVFNQTDLSVSYNLEENYQDNSTFNFKL